MVYELGSILEVWTGQAHFASIAVLVEAVVEYLVGWGAAELVVVEGVWVVIWALGRHWKQEKMMEVVNIFLMLQTSEFFFDN